MATYMLGNAIAARFAQRVGSLRLLVAGRSLAFAAALGLALWGGAAELTIWALFLPIALAEIGDGMSQPSVMAAALSLQPRLAGTASGLMGFLQMMSAALGSFLVALLPYENAFGMITVFGGFVALALVSGMFAVRCIARAGHPVLPVAAAPAAEGS
jgi:MFS transporter, DHA1 family, multidrug resistance protein